MQFCKTKFWKSCKIRWLSAFREKNPVKLRGNLDRPHASLYMIFSSSFAANFGCNQVKRSFYCVVQSILCPVFGLYEIDTRNQMKSKSLHLVEGQRWNVKLQNVKLQTWNVKMQNKLSGMTVHGLLWSCQVCRCTVGKVFF